MSPVESNDCSPTTRVSRSRQEITWQLSIARSFTRPKWSTWKADGQWRPCKVPHSQESSKRSDDWRMVRQRLVELGMTADQLAELDRSGQPQSRITLYAPIGGTVIESCWSKGNMWKWVSPFIRSRT